MIVVDRSLAPRADAPPGALAVVPRLIRPSRPWHRGAGWHDVLPERAVDTVRVLPRSAIVLARSPGADPGGSCVAAVARLFGHRPLKLPEPPQAALWVVATAVEWWAAGLPQVERALAVACGLAAEAWASVSEDHVDPPLADLPRGTVGRWAGRAFAACGWCRHGGGLPGAPCAVCGAAVAESFVPVGPLAQVVPLRRVA